MGEPKFTKGALRVVDQGDGRFPLVCGEGGIIDWVAVVNGGPEAMANAQVFASAPDLYAALHRCREILSDLARPPDNYASVSTAMVWAHCVAAEKLARAALAKARGES